MTIKTVNYFTKNMFTPDPIEVLIVDNKGSTPELEEQWRINFSRVERRFKNVNLKYEKEIIPASKKPYPENNRVWSPHGLIAMHYSEMWGYIQYSDSVSGKGKVKLEKRKYETAKWALRKLSFNEETFYLNNQAYTNGVSKLDMRDMFVEGYIRPSKIESTTNLFETRFVNSDGKEIISIKNEGEVTARK